VAAALLTDKQLRLLRLVEAWGLGVAEAARRLGVSRQDAWASLRRARRRYREALETVLLYAAHAGPVARGEPGETVEALVDRLLREADRAGVRLRLGRLEAAALVRRLLGDAQEDGVLRRSVCVAVEPTLGIPLVVPCPRECEG